jgi:hypothetical protein
MHELGPNKKYLREWVMMKVTPRVDPTRDPRQHDQSPKRSEHVDPISSNLVRSEGGACPVAQEGGGRRGEGGRGGGKGGREREREEGGVVVATAAAAFVVVVVVVVVVIRRVRTLVVTPPTGASDSASPGERGTLHAIY